ncbi:MAG: hypothetical protein J6T62_08610 [Fibrobacter sp.]|nr:hypothetical protein [Fibrobacter sp.]
MKSRVLFLVMSILLGASCLWAQNALPKKEMYSRARDMLKESLERRDFELAGEAYGYLRAHVSEGAPLTIFEEYLIDMEMGKYADGIRKYASELRILLDSSYVPGKETQRVLEKDALHKHLYDPFNPFTVAKVDSMVNLVDASDVDSELKDLYATMMYAELTLGFDGYSSNLGRIVRCFVKDTTRADQFLVRARSYVGKSPYTEHSGYLKASIIPLVETVVTRMHEFNENPLKHKYYTGGLGLYGGFWTGFITGDAADHIQTKMGQSFNIEGSLQFGRVSLNAFWNYGIISTPDSANTDGEYEYEDDAVGLTLGFTAYELRFMRFEPFIGFGTYDFMTFIDESSNVFVLGLNTDVRYPLKKPSRYGGMALLVVMRFKYQALFGTLENKKYGIDGGFVTHQFGANLGFFIW